MLATGCGLRSRRLLGHLRLDRERATVLGAALRVIAIDPRGALGVFHVWTEAGEWDEWLLDLAGWGVLAYQIEDDRERLLVLRWVDWWH
jgi:hypothetical protein